MDHTFSTIGILHTPWREKFGVPRQSMMIPEAWGVLKLKPDPQYEQALSQLDTFSHVWILFVFNKNKKNKWHPIIHPPRLGVSNIGVFASRSPRRPNAIGMSAVRLVRIDYEAVGGIEVHLEGIDLLDGTEVLDIKPYLPYADALPDASSGWAKGDIAKYPVLFSPEAEKQLAEVTTGEDPRLVSLIHTMLALDPRPTSQREGAPILDPQSEGKRFAFRVQHLDIHWEIQQGSLYALSVKKHLA